MSRIDLNNYEAWFLDYIEGNLSLEDKNLFMEFLELHPELKEELDLDFTHLSLQPVSVKLADKSSLLMQEDDLVLSPVTIDDLMIESVEGNLSEKQNLQLASYIADHKLDKEYLAYKSSTLVPDLTIQMEGKDKLKVRAAIFPLYARVASVAAVGIVLIGLTMNYIATDPVSAHNPKGNVSLTETIAKYSPDASFDEQPVESFAIHIESPDKNVKENVKKEHHPIQPERINPNTFNEVVKVDSTSTSNPVIEDKIILPDEITEQIDSTINVPIANDDISQNVIRKEEPYKLFTDAAGNILNRDVSFTRNKDVQQDEYVAYSFKLGSFEFERKKAK